MSYPLVGSKWRSGLVGIYDVLSSIVAWLAAYWLRFNLDLSHHLSSALITMACVVPLQVSVFLAFGLYRGIWRFASLPDLKRILLAVGVAALASPALLSLLQLHGDVPRSVLLLNPLLLIFMMGGSRLLYRAWKEHHLSALLHPGAKSVLVIGAGSAADLLLRELAGNGSGYRVVGLLDDDKSKLGRHLRGIPVLGAISELEKWSKQRMVSGVILAVPTAHHELRKQVADVCSEAGLDLLTVPAFADLMSGKVMLTNVRPIELDDLLGRDPVQLDSGSVQRLLTGRVVMVTGAGGSIGSELCRQVAGFEPALLLMVEFSEIALYQIEQEFLQNFPDCPIACIVADVKDAAYMRNIMMHHLPFVVFHAAAYKHVPLMEESNAFQALRNNALGTMTTAMAAMEAGVEKFVLISTDKAVNPTNVMGASKRLAEMICQRLRGVDGTQFVSVRFGNVLGSSGSVIPKFQAQIEAGGPVTITHPEITRYFMSIPEAAQLVVQAGVIGQGGEIYVLDMGDPVKIVDLAYLMIKLAGKMPDEIKIIYTGLRPGEKLYEELLADKEATLPTPHAKLRVAQAREVDGMAVDEILDWIKNTASANDGIVREKLRAVIPEYCPSLRGGSVATQVKSAFAEEGVKVEVVL